MKVFVRILKWLFLSLIGLAALIFLLLALDGECREAANVEMPTPATIKSQKEYDPQVDSSLFYSLLQEYGHHKTLAKGFEYQCLLALSHYPELKETRIEFRVKPAFIPLSSRPDPISVIFPWVKRKYLVVISNASTDYFEPILLENIPFNEQVGIIGHELAHSVFYLDKCSLALTGIAYRYSTDDDYRTQFERETDKRAIAHGLAYQMYDFAFFVRKAFGDTQEEIAAEEGDMYLSPKEIASEMGRYGFYRDSLRAAESYFDVVE